jgi:hypothetical protein
MLHLFGGDTVARRQAPTWRFPWKFALTVLAIVLVATVAASAIFSVVTNFSSPAPQPIVAQQPEVDVPAVVVPATDVQNPPVQTEPMSNLHSAIQGNWSESYPVETLPPNAGKTEPGNLPPEDARLLTAIQILPELQTLYNERAGIWVVTSKAGNTVLLGITVFDGRQAMAAMKRGETPTEEMTQLWAKLFLSMDGENSWYPILLPEGKNQIPGVAISRADGVLRLSVEENTVRMKWRDMILPLKDLP